MSLSRLVLLCFGLLLLCLLGAGIYIYQNLPSLLAQQAQRYLQEYGVQDLRLEQLQFSGNQLSTDELWLRGEQDGLMFEATLSSLDIGYHWRMLLNGQLQSVSLANLDMSVEQVATGTRAAPVRVSVESLLPQPLIADLPVQSANIEKWNLEYRSPGSQPLSAEGNLVLTDQLSVHLQATYLESLITADIWTGGTESILGAHVLLGDGDARALELEAKLDRAAAGQWQWNLLGELHYAPTLAWLRGIDPDRESAPDIRALEGLTLLGSSTFSAQVRHPDNLDFPGEVGQPMLRQPMLGQPMLRQPMLGQPMLRQPMLGQPVLNQLSASIDIVNNITQLDYPATVEGVTGIVDISLALDSGQLDLTVAPTELTGKVHTRQWSLPAETQQWLQWEDTVPVRWQNASPVKIALTNGNTWSLQLRDTRLVLGNKSSEIRWESLTLDTWINPDKQMQLNTQLSARIKTRLHKKQLPQLDLVFSHQGPIEKSELGLSLQDTAESMSLGVQAAVNLKTGNGAYSLSARSLDLSYAAGTVLPLMRKFGLLQASVEILGGDIALNSELKSTGFDIARLKQQSQLLIKNMSGSYGEYRFEGMDLTAAWSGIEKWKTRRSVEFGLAKLNVGFDLVDIQALLALPKSTPIAQPVVNIEQFSAGVFGGRVYLPEPRQWDFGGQTNALTLRAEQWRLEDIVALQHGQDIQARGVLEGQLPIAISDGRITIAKGYLRALAPGGSIRYIANEASQALAATSSELELAMDLLSDFQYQVLSSDVELDKEGNLVLGLSLAGKNPARYDGRPVNFNINLEQNLDPLLQSLRLSDKLVEQIEGRLN